MLPYLRNVSFGAVAAFTAMVSISIPASAEVSSRPYQRMLAKLESLKTYQVVIQESTLLQPTDPSAKARTIASSDVVAYRSPNLFSLVNNGLLGGVTIVADGKTEYFYSSLTEQYASRTSPPHVLDNVLGALHGGAANWISITSEVVGGTAVTELHGTIASPRGEIDLILDLRKSDALPVRAIMTLPTVSGATGSGLRITRTEMFTNQKVNQAVPMSLFTFVPPDGSTKVNSLSELGSGFGGGL